MIGVWVAATGAAIVWWRAWSPRVEQRRDMVAAAVRALEAARLQELFDLPEYIPEHERR